MSFSMAISNVTHPVYNHLVDLRKIIQRVCETYENIQRYQKIDLEKGINFNEQDMKNVAEKLKSLQNKNFEALVDFLKKCSTNNHSMAAYSISIAQEMGLMTKNQEIDPQAASVIKVFNKYGYKIQRL